LGFENSNLYSRVKDVMVFLGDNSLRGDKRLKEVVIFNDDSEGNQLFWYHNDHLNTPVLMTDEKGEVVWDIVNKFPFGEFTTDSREGGPYGQDRNGDDIYILPENNLRFPGQYYYAHRIWAIENGKGPYYNNHRWYNPETGRFFSIERIDKFPYQNLGWMNGLYALYITAETNNTFGYGYNNPIKLVDMNGLRPGDVFPNIYDAIADAIYESFVEAQQTGVEWGGCIRPAMDISTEKPQFCVNKFPRFYTYDEPYPWTEDEFLPRVPPECLVIFHAHTSKSGPGISGKDYDRMKLWDRLMGIWAAVGTIEQDIILISPELNVYKAGEF